MTEPGGPDEPPIRALVVDYGGVLTVPIRGAFEAWLEADGIAPEAFGEVLEEWRATPGNPMHQLETGELSADDFADYLVARLRRRDGGAVDADGLHDRIFAALHVDPDAFVMLRAARAAGLKTALLSNSWDFPYPWEQLDPLLDVKIVSGEVGLRKPDPAIYQLAGAELGLPLTACAFVDDIAVNVAAAAELGMFAVLHTDLASTLAALVTRMPELTPHLPDLPASGDQLRPLPLPDLVPTPSNSQEADVSDSPRKVALVTGAARGIGAATALRLARDGYAVGVLDLESFTCTDTVSAIEHAGGAAVALGADVANAVEVAEAVRRCVEHLGEPTVLVNNAGVTRDNLLFKMSEADWDQVLGVHLRGAFLMSRAVQGFMTTAKWGRIVNLSSTSALGNRGQANYAAAKAGMQGFTKTLAIELGPFGVTVNAIAPGFIATEMTTATAVRLNMTVEDFHHAASEQIPLRRVGQPDDIAGVVSFLVSDDASYVSGQVIYVAGGPKD